MSPEGECARQAAPYKRLYWFLSFGSVWDDLVLSKNWDCIGELVIGPQSCEPAKDVPPSQPRSKCNSNEKAGWVCAGQKCLGASTSGTAVGARGCWERHLRVATQERGKPLLGNSCFWLISGFSKHYPPQRVTLESKDVARLVPCWLSMLKAHHLIPSPDKLGVGGACLESEAGDQQARVWVQGGGLIECC